MEKFNELVNSDDESEEKGLLSAELTAFHFGGRFLLKKKTGSAGGRKLIDELVQKSKQDEAWWKEVESEKVLDTLQEQEKKPQKAAGALDMSKCHSELTQREQALLKIRRDSDTKACELAKMEKMLQQTKSLLDRKTDSDTESMVEDLEEKVRSSRRHRRNSLHHTQMLESQMKTVKGELVGTLDHLQELRNVLRRSQQKAEERKAAMEKLAAGLR